MDSSCLDLGVPGFEGLRLTMDLFWYGVVAFWVEAACLEAQARWKAFRDWFSGASVAAYVNLAEFETNAPKDSKLV